MDTENVNIKNWKSLIKPSKIDVQMSDDLSKACLLYTSPSPRDRSLSRMPSSA